MDKYTTYHLTDKENAYLLACETGLCPKIKGGYDTTKFDEFYKLFEIVLHSKDKTIEMYRNACSNTYRRIRLTNIVLTSVNLLLMAVWLFIRLNF